MGQPTSGLFKRIGFSTLILLTLSGCRLVSFFTHVPLTPTPTLTPTPASENCFWNWAYGAGSTDFDNAVTKSLMNKGVVATVNSSSYGEIYSCDNSFHAKDLDVKVNITVESLADHELLAKTSEEVLSLLQNNLPASNVNNLGNVNLTYVTPDGNTCYWNREQKQCTE